MWRVLAVGCLMAGCAGAQEGSGGKGAAEDASAVFGPLEVGADYATTFTKINKEPFVSKDHGGRFVNTYANAKALEKMFEDEAIFPVGSIVVKESFANQGGKPSDVRGPTFVMEKREEGFNPEQNDWWYAIHWENGEKSLYWRTPSTKANYCFDCHKKWMEHDTVAVAIPDSNLADQFVEAPAEAEFEEVETSERSSFALEEKPVEAMG